MSKNFKSVDNKNSSKKNEPITLILMDDDNNEELGRTKVDSVDDIVSYSISYHINTDETIVYVFDSNVEIFRENGNVSKEDIADIIDDFASFYILSI